MNPAPIGTRIRITGNSNSHHYRPGGVYRVHEVDDDGTFKAIDEYGTVGDYLKWRDCEPVGIGWEWLRTQLDARSLDLLAAFEGVEHLTLRPEIEAMLVSSIPRLDQAILGVLPGIEENAAGLAASFAATAAEDDDLNQLFGEV